MIEREREAHVVVDIATPEKPTSISPLKHHPLAEISHSPGHLLLLKLWQREEDLLGRKMAATETLIQSSRSQVFRLCSIFFFFHAIFLTLLFVESDNETCRRWWLPCFLSLATSLVFSCAVHGRLREFWKRERRLQKERGEARAVGRLVQELRMKGMSFDLNKVPVAGGSRRMKSAGEEMRWRVVRWCRRNLLTVGLLGFSALVVPAGKFVICG